MTCILATVLSGCALSDALDEMSMDQYRKQCDRFGFQRNTDAYSNCLMRQAAQENEDLQHSLDRENQREVAKESRDR